MDLGFHLAMSYHYLKRPTSRKNFGDVVGQNHALILTQCHMLTSENIGLVWSRTSHYIIVKINGDVTVTY